MKQITVDIAPDGGVKIEAAGFTGPDCEQATKFLEDALGTVEQKHRKPEYHQRQTRQASARVGNHGDRT